MSATIDDTAYTVTGIPRLIARHMVRSGGNTSDSVVDEEHLTRAMVQVTPETQIYGSSLLVVTLTDPAWEIQRSGLLAVDADGLLERIEVNFPEGTDVWWRLAMVEGGNDLAGPNLTLTFIDRILGYLQDNWGPKVAAPGTTTRAQFIKQLVDEVGKGDGHKPINFVCPELNVVQPIADATKSSPVDPLLTVVPKSQPKKKAQHAQTNKLRHLGYGSNLTIKGSRITRHQTDEANNLMDEATRLNAPAAACYALLFAAIAESDLGDGAGTYSNNGAPGGGYWGVLQGGARYWPDPHDTTALAKGFLLGGNKGFNAGGGIAMARQGADPITIAVKVEVPDGGQGYGYSREGGYDGQGWLAEAKAIVQAYGGAPLGGGDGTTSRNVSSDVTQLRRGTQDNADEDSWACIERLAAEVNWFAFSNANYLYYMDGPDLISQKPAAYLELDEEGTSWNLRDPDTNRVAENVISEGMTYTFDDTAFAYQSDHKRKGRLQRKTRIRVPQTPAQVRFDMVCGVMEFRAGDVFIFRYAGPLDGRWIVADVKQDVLANPFASFVLVPSTVPLPEPAATQTSSGLGVHPVTGGTIEGYVNPLQQIKGLVGERIDMGVDYGGSGHLLALGDATVYAAADSGTGWPRYLDGNNSTGGAVCYTLTSGPYRGKHIYVAENITVHVSPGDKVKAGQVIATLHSGGANMETGWASGTSTSTLAASLGQDGTHHGYSDPGAIASAAGHDFNKLLVALGAPSGTPGTHGDSPGPGMPKDWPTFDRHRKVKDIAHNAEAVVEGAVGRSLDTLGGIFASIWR